MSRKRKKRYCKECDVPIPKGKHHCSKHKNIWDRPSFQRLKCNSCNITKPKHYFAKGQYTCSVCINMNGNQSSTGRSTGLINKYLGKDAQTIFTRHRQFSRSNRINKKKLSKHEQDLRTTKKQLRDLKKEYKTKIARVEGVISRKKSNIKKMKEGYKNRNKERNIIMSSLIDTMMDSFPMSDYDNKNDWTSSILQMEELLCKYSGVPIGVIREIRQDKYKTNDMWTQHIDDEVKKIQPKYTGNAPWLLDCINCTNQMEYPKRSSLIRALGLNGNTDKKNKGMCTSCSSAEEREGWTLSEENANIRRLNSHNYAHGTNYTDVSEIPTFPISLESYRNKVYQRSDTQLKRYKPNEYQRLILNRWDGTDMNQLTIDHLKEVSWCYYNRISIEECSDISNLEVVTMKENWLRHKQK